MQATTATQFRVLERRDVGGDAFVLRMDRHALAFEPGQYLSVGRAGSIHMREYSIYSGTQEPHLEILVKRVQDGFVSRELGALEPGDGVAVDGPFGYFTIDEAVRGERFVFIATGSGISPFHAFVRSYPNLDYRLLHGIRTLDERFEYDAYERSRITTCVTRAEGGDFDGRVTAYLRAHPVDADARYYLCGNCDMIYEAFDILQEAGVPHGHLFAEVYF